MNHVNISITLLFLTCFVGSTYSMSLIYGAYELMYRNRLTTLHDAITGAVKEEVVKQALNQSEDAFDGTKQLAKFSQLSRGWNEVVMGFANSNAFKKYEANGVCIKPYPIFTI